MSWVSALWVCGFVAAGGVGCGRAGFDVVPPDVDGGTDDDRDGVLDGPDNCPALANPTQHDEDADQVGDACDPCPHLAGDLADGDLDGVGDACDPAPSTPGNTIVTFLAFDEPALPPEWTPLITAPGSATLENDAFVVALPTDRVARLTAPVTSGDVTIEASVTIDAIAPNAGNPARNIALIDNYAPTPDSGPFFGMVQDYGQGPPARASILQVTNGVGSNVYMKQDADTTLRLGAAYRLRYARAGNVRDLLVEAAEGTFMLSANIPDTDGQCGLRARGIDARFHYLVIIQ